MAAPPPSGNSRDGAIADARPKPRAPHVVRSLAAQARATCRAVVPRLGQPSRPAQPAPDTDSRVVGRPGARCCAPCCRPRQRDSLPRKVTSGCLQHVLLMIRILTSAYQLMLARRQSSSRWPTRGRCWRGFPTYRATEAQRPTSAARGPARRRSSRAVYCQPATGSTRRSHSVPTWLRNRPKHGRCDNPPR